MTTVQVCRHLLRTLFPIVSNQSYLLLKTYNGVLLKIECAKQLIDWKVSHSFSIAAKVLFASVCYRRILRVLIELTNAAGLFKITHWCYIYTGWWLKWTFWIVCSGLYIDILASCKDARTRAYTSPVGCWVNVASDIFGFHCNRMILEILFILITYPS